MQSITKELTPNFQGYTNLCEALAVMKKVAEDINETQRLYEASVRTQVSAVNLCTLFTICVHIIV